MFREEAGRVNAALIRSLGSFELAEDAFQDAVAHALDRWPTDGVPRNPAAWLTTTARRRAIDRLRRETNLTRKKADLRTLHLLEQQAAPDEHDDDPVGDERLKLVFTCCHPALPREAQVGLTLRTLCGLTTPEIARAFLVPEATLAQRLVRAKRKIRLAGIPYRVPPPELLGERTPEVLAVVYLVFNEGYAASSGDALIRQGLCVEAIRLGRLLLQLMPAEPEVRGLLALMLAHDARREARVGIDGIMVPLEDQDRALWDHPQIAEASQLAHEALAAGRPGPYQIQAAISALHGQAESAAETDWPQIAGLYGALHTMHPSPVVALNRAVAVAMAEGAERGLALVDALAEDGGLEGYPYLPAARADLLRRLGRAVEASAAYQEALALVENAGERAYLRRRLAEVAAGR